MNEKLTPWFEPEVEPVHPGPYLVDFGGSSELTEYHFWGHGRWWYGDYTPERTVAQFLACSVREAKPTPKRWRGLATKPKATK